MPARRLVAILPLCLSAGCAGPKAGPATVRLADLYKPAAVEGRPADVPPRPRTEWRFDAPGSGKLAATRGWEAGPGVAGLAVRDSRLVGQSTTDFPMLHLVRTSGLEDRDLLHAIEVRARTSVAGRLSVAVRAGEKIDFAELQKDTLDAPWRMSTPDSSRPRERSPRP
jgi:hypothetical protein